jgi:hypothetical protein
VLLQLVGALQVGQQPLGGLRVAPHRGGRCRGAVAGPDAEAPIAGDGMEAAAVATGGGSLWIGRRRIGFGLIWVRSRCRAGQGRAAAAAASSGRKRRGERRSFRSWGPIFPGGTWCFRNSSRPSDPTMNGPRETAIK